MCLKKPLLQFDDFAAGEEESTGAIYLPAVGAEVAAWVMADGLHPAYPAFLIDAFVKRYPGFSGGCSIFLGV